MSNQAKGTALIILQKVITDVMVASELPKGFIHFPTKENEIFVYKDNNGNISLETKSVGPVKTVHNKSYNFSAQLKVEGKNQVFVKVKGLHREEVIRKTSLVNALALFQAANPTIAGFLGDLKPLILQANGRLVNGLDKKQEEIGKFISRFPSGLIDNYALYGNPLYGEAENAPVIGFEIFDEQPFLFFEEANVVKSYTISYNGQVKTVTSEEAIIGFDCSGLVPGTVVTAGTDTYTVNNESWYGVNMYLSPNSDLYKGKELDTFTKNMQKIDSAYVSGKSLNISHDAYRKELVFALESFLGMKLCNAGTKENVRLVWRDRVPTLGADNKPVVKDGVEQSTGVKQNTNVLTDLCLKYGIMKKGTKNALIADMSSDFEGFSAFLEQTVISSVIYSADILTGNFSNKFSGVPVETADGKFVIEAIHTIIEAPYKVTFDDTKGSVIVSRGKTIMKTIGKSDIEKCQFDMVTDITPLAATILDGAPASVMNDKEGLEVFYRNLTTAVNDLMVITGLIDNQPEALVKFDNSKTLDEQIKALSTKKRRTEQRAATYRYNFNSLFD